MAKKWAGISTYHATIRKIRKEHNNCSRDEAVKIYNNMKNGDKTEELPVVSATQVKLNTPEDVLSITDKSIENLDNEIMTMKNNLAEMKTAREKWNKIKTALA